MKSVKIKTKELLKVLKANRDTHVKEYNEAVVGYKEKIVSELETMLADAKAGKDVSHVVDVVKPTSYEDSYTTEIKMLEMSDDAVVELSHAEFIQFVEDKWSWKSSFTSTTAIYKKP